ncbi:MAG TPA: DinB family protein [Jiangellaceae bacterium]
MTTFRNADQFRDAQFIDVDMTGAQFRETDLTGTRMRGVILVNADIDGYIRDLVINGVDVVPLVEAELDRRHPERTKLRPTTPQAAREAWDVVESLWAATVERARRLNEADLHRSVDDEWSFAETLRHLVMVTDAWLSRAVLAESRPFHPIGLPASFLTNGAEFGIDADAEPSFDEVLAVRADRMARVRAFVDSATQDDLDRTRDGGAGAGWPPAASRSATACLHVILNEEWTHHQFAVRDLAIIEGES